MELFEKARFTKYSDKKPDGKGGWIYTYPKDTKKRRNRIISKDIKDFGQLKTIEIYEKIEKIRKDKNNENSINIDSEGNILLFKKGEVNNVFFSKNELSQINGCKLSIHNHPNGNCFSPQDVSFLLNNNIKEIRVIGIKNNIKTNYSLRIKKEITDNEKKDIVKSFNYIHHVVFNKFKKNVNENKINSQYATESFLHEVMKSFAFKNRETMEYERY